MHCVQYTYIAAQHGWWIMMIIIYYNIQFAYRLLSNVCGQFLFWASFWANYNCYVRCWLHVSDSSSGTFFKLKWLLQKAEMWCYYGCNEAIDIHGTVIIGRVKNSHTSSPASVFINACDWWEGHCDCGFLYPCIIIQLYHNNIGSIDSSAKRCLKYN